MSKESNWLKVMKLCTGSVYGGTGWYLVVLGQYRAVMVCTWWRYFSVGRVLSLVVLGGTGSE